MKATPDGRRRRCKTGLSLEASSRPLTGITILEAVAADAPAALALAAGLCGRIAGDLGAAVQRVPGHKLPASVEAFLHSGKRMVEPETDPAALADTMDAVLLDHASHEATGRQLRRAIPIVLGMSQDAPMGGSEFTIEARSGLLDLVGDPAREPLRLAGHQAAYSAGLSAYLGLVSALSRRQAGETPQAVHVDLLDVAVWLNWKTLVMAELTGRPPRRAGSAAEWVVVPCRDGHIALVYRFQEWEALKKATGDARLQEPRFQTPSLRRRNRTELNAILAGIFAPMTRAEIRTLALKTKLPLGPIWTPEELQRDPHMIARSFFQPVEWDGRTVAMPSLPVKWNGTTFAPANKAADAREAAE
jgi:crotonobetainyl-CoA:carnitine CoA-transferase CaiB-like acyl-CoA transferase